MRQPTTALLLAATLAACTGGSKDGEPGPGAARDGGPAAAAAVTRQVASTQAKRLLVSADGAWLAWLEGCTEVRGRYLPPGASSCGLQVAPSAGGAPVTVARAVTSLPHGATFSPDGALLAVLADYDYEAGAGTLVLVKDGAAREVATGVTFHGFAAGGGVLLAVAGGKLLAVSPDGAARPIPGAEGVATFAVAPPPWAGRAVAVLARRPVAAGGTLLVIGPGLDQARPVATGTSEFGLAASDAWAFTAMGRAGAELHLGRGARATRVAGGARAFAFSPDGTALAWVSDAAPGKQGDLHAAPVGGAVAVLGREVGEHRWAAAAPRLAWLAQYDPRSRTGVLGTGGPALVPRTFGRAVSDFELSPDGRHLAYLRHTTEGGYSVDLELAAVEGDPKVAVRKVARGVFGFAFSPDGRWLYLRTRCTRQAEACDLERVAVAGAAGAPPEPLAQGVKSFEFDPRDPERLLVTWQRADLVALDLAVWRAGVLTAVDQGALAGSIRFLGPDSRRLAYAVVQPKRAGVYVAQLP
jgi:WD40 repeat protein